MFEKKCLGTGEIFRTGRSDKKFINGKARNTYHNKIKRDKARIFKKIDKQLHLNHEILEKYYEETKGEKGIFLSFLMVKGFDPKVHFGAPISPEFENRSKVYYSYDHKYTYDKESKKITIQKIQKRLMPKY